MRLEDYARMFTKLEANILCAEYRGYGDCDGSPCEDGYIQLTLLIGLIGSPQIAIGRGKPPWQGGVPFCTSHRKNLALGPGN